MGLFKDAPEAPDYTAAAVEQGEAAKEVTRMQTYANRPDQFTPFGASTWQAQAITDPATGTPTTRWAQTIGLTPASQQALEAQQRIVAGRAALGQGLMGEAALELESPQGFFDTLPTAAQAPDLPSYYGDSLTPMGGIPARTEPPDYSQVMGPDPSASIARQAVSDFSLMPRMDASRAAVFDPTTTFSPGGMMTPGLDFTGAGDVGTGATTRNRVEDAMYGRSTSRLDPQWQQAASGLESKLANQGLRPGDAAWETQMDNFNRARNDAYSSARQDAIIAGGAEATREFGMDLGRRQQTVGEVAQAGGFANQAQQQQFAQNQMMANFQNQARAGDLQRQLAERAAFNQVQQGMFGQNVAANTFSNQAQQQAFAQAAALRGELASGAGAEFQQSVLQSKLADQQRAQQVSEQLAYGQQGFSQDMQRAQYQQQLRQQAIVEQMQREGWSLNKINALLSGGQVAMPSMPSFTAASKAEPTQYLAAAKMQGDAALDAFNAEQAALQGMMSGAGSLMTGMGDFRGGTT